jgi:anti-sigma regulatory factor (Ser/Thr protein kinase)
VIRTGEPEFLEEIPAEAVGALGPEYRREIDALGLRSVVIVPLTSPDGRPVGALALVTAESGRTLDEHDVVLGLELGRRCGTAIDNARVYRERSDIAQTLQRSLLPPELPEIPGVAVAACFRPAGHGVEMGGDFYDVFTLSDGSWALTIGDVCGKGPAAAALTALVRYTLRAVTMHAQSPDRVLELLNEAIIRNGVDDRFCSVAFARLVSTEDGVRAEIASGGHPQPLLVRADGRVEEVPSTGLLLGLWPDPKLESAMVDLGPGDALVLYTDGVTDARAPDLILAPDDMAELLRDSAGCPAPEVARRIERAVTEGAEHEPRDDIALLVLGVESRVRTTRADDRTVQVELGSRADAALLARRAIVELADALPNETVEELKLLATEMVTNSVKHAGAGGAIVLELRIDGRVVQLSVTDSGAGFEPRAPSSDPEAEAGRGLFIVDALASRWGVDTGPGTRVWAELEVAFEQVPATPPPAQLPRRS